MDYVPTSTTRLHFTEAMQSATFTIQVFQDHLTERTESFAVSLTRVISISVGGVNAEITNMDKNRIMFYPKAACIDIKDSDGKTYV